jgi:serine/threonine-protein kinase
LQSNSPLVTGVAQPGTVLLGKYRVERVLGIGGMGAVVAARHLQLDESVAIKFLLPATAEQPEIVQRFLREARSAIKIRSEHCVRVLDVGTLDAGAPYMVMEYLDGQDLSRVVEEQGPLPIVDAVDWVLQAAEALAEAHAMGIVHRDLKPANLFLTRRADGTPSLKVLDFGISKQTGTGPGAADAGVTNTQAVLGSPRYMSPEQMRSTRDVDARADVWALGAVIHELISGKPPFDAETVTALCAAILQDPPNPLRARRPDAPVPLEMAILGALEKDRAYRYQNVAELAGALAPFGTPAATASAERIARVLGVPASGPGAMRPRTPSGSQFLPPSTNTSPLAATTGGAVTDASQRRPSTGALLAVAAAVSALGLIGAGGFVAFRKHSVVAAGPAQEPSATQYTATPSAGLSSPPPLPSAALAEPAVLPAAATRGASNVVLPAEQPVRPARPVSGGPRQPGSSGARPPSSGSSTGSPPAAPKPSALPAANPFGDDRKG